MHTHTHTHTHGRVKQYEWVEGETPLRKLRCMLTGYLMGVLLELIYTHQVCPERRTIPHVLEGKQGKRGKISTPTG